MTDQENSQGSVDPHFQPFVDQWATCLRHANESTIGSIGAFAGSPDPQVWRREWFAALSGNADGYLRSPLFLETMKMHIDALIQSHQSKSASPSQPTIGDEAFADRWGNLDPALQTRLAQLEQRMDALENRSGDPDTNGWDQFLSVLHVPSAATAVKLDTTPHEVVYEEGSLRLLRYHNDAIQFAPPVLICFALVNRPYVLDLQGGRSVVRRLLERGLDVYLIDWGTPTASDHRLQLHDYVCRLMKNASDVVCDRTGMGQLNLLGYCMGGTLSTIFTALYPERVCNLILMATPIDFAGEEGLLNLWARKEYFDVDKLIDAYGNCPGEFLQYCFQLMRPVQNFVQKYLMVCEKLDDEAFLDNFFAMERWANDSVPVAGETFREYVKKLYQQNQLIHGQMSIGAAAVNLNAITCPLLLLTADRDHLVPPRSTLALQQHVASDKIASMSIDAGHIGLAVSTKAHRQLWPAAADWIAEHSTEIS